MAGRQKQGRKGGAGKADTGKPAVSKAKSGVGKPGAGRSGRGRWLLLALALVGAFAVYEYVTLPSAAPLKTRNPATTALIEQRAIEARQAGKKPRRKQQWVGLAAVSKPAVAAVLLSEDSGFFQHGGVELGEIQKAVQEAWEKHELGRGASTITQQLAKNLWLSTDRSLLRKAKELVLARRLEDSMTKGRILAIYLNVAEWGDGLYGIEAAAREYFGVPASQLTPAQGAVLAAMLPAPRKRTPASGSPALRRRAQWIVDQMRYVRIVSPEQAEVAHREVDQLLGWAKPDTGEDDGDVDES